MRRMFTEKKIKELASVEANKVGEAIIKAITPVYTIYLSNCCNSDNSVVYTGIVELYNEDDLDIDGEDISCQLDRTITLTKGVVDGDSGNLNGLYTEKNTLVLTIDTNVVSEFLFGLESLDSSFLIQIYKGNTLLREIEL